MGPVASSGRPNKPLLNFKTDTDNQRVIVQVKDVNDEPPYFINRPLPMQAVVQLNAPPNTPVFTLQARDPDTDHNIHYFLVRDRSKREKTPSPLTCASNGNVFQQPAADSKWMSDPVWFGPAEVSPSSSTWSTSCTSKPRIKTADWMTDATNRLPKSGCPSLEANDRLSSTCPATRPRSPRIRKRTPSRTQFPFFFFGDRLISLSPSFAASFRFEPSLLPSGRFATRSRHRDRAPARSTLAPRRATSVWPRISTLKIFASLTSISFR